MGRVLRLAVLLAGVSVLVGVLAGIWQLLVVGEGEGFDWDIRAPVDVPVWLKSRGLGLQQSERGHPLVYAEQFWCTIPGAEEKDPAEVWREIESALDWAEQPAGYGCIYLAEVPAQLEINAAGKEGVTVDDVEGWLWRLSSDDFAAPLAAPAPGGLDFQVTGALVDRYGSEYERYYFTAIYAGLYGLRRRHSVLAGPALAIQWNRDNAHYLLVGQDRPPITREVLLQIADSMDLTGRVVNVLYLDTVRKPGMQKASRSAREST